MLPKFVQLFHVNSGMCLRFFLFRFFYSVFFLDEYLQGLEWLNGYMCLHMSSVSQVYKPTSQFVIDDKMQKWNIFFLSLFSLLVEEFV